MRQFDTRSVNPRTILWQVIVSAVLLMGVAVVASPKSAFGAAGFSLITALALNASYARALGARGRPKRRITGDRWVGRHIAIMCAPPLALASLLLAHGYRSTVTIWDFNRGETSALLMAPAILFVLIVVSSLIDWYYVRPRIDGLICSPPCSSSGAPIWKRATRRWLLHRGLATVAYIGFALAIALVLAIMLFREHPAAASVIGGVSGIASLLLIFAGDYRAQLPTITKWVLAPAFYLGDDLSFDGNRRTGRGFVLHTSVPVTKLVPLDETGAKTDVPFIEVKNSDLADAQLASKPTRSCADGCARLNPECVVGDKRLDKRRRLLIF